MDSTTLSFTLLIMLGGVATQRSPYAGRRPIGYPEIDPTTTTTSADGLGNRFNNGETTTTERLPLEALGDRDLVIKISKLPVDKQPFWYLNWKAMEEHRNNPQTYAQKPNTFIDRFPQQEPINNAMTNNQQRFENPPRNKQFQSDLMENGQRQSNFPNSGFVPSPNSFLGSLNNDERFNTNSFPNDNFNSPPSANGNWQAIFPNTQYPNSFNPNNQQFRRRIPMKSWQKPNNDFSNIYPSAIFL